MNRLLTLSDEVISQYVNFEKGFDSIKIKNRTLDGNSHIQTIGSPLQVFDIDLVVDKTGKEKLNECEANSEPVKLTDGIDTYTCLISDTPSWDKFVENTDYYQASIKLEKVIT
jgi:hypothetical protein